MRKKRRRRTKRTPIQNALQQSSALQSAIKPGIGAVAAAHRVHLDAPIRRSFEDSLDLDLALQEGHEQENRWDYLLGHAPSAKVIALEPHSAREDAISTVIRKRKAAKQQLTDHWRPGMPISIWLWVASGPVRFADTEKARRRLDQEGIQFVGRQVLKKHLPDAKKARTSRRR